MTEKEPQFPGKDIERMTFEFGASSKKGKKYEINHDRHFTNKQANAGGVFDGIGTKTKGEAAAEIAKAQAEREVMNSGYSSSQEKCKAILESMNNAVLEQRKLNPEKQSMSTTGAFVVLEKGGTGAFGSVGDTRVYLVMEDGSIEQITTDDVPGDLENFVFQNGDNAVTDWLGNEDFQPKTGVFSLEKVVYVVVVSDGVYKVIPDQQMANIIMSSFGTQEAADDLVNVAENLESMDDKTAVIIKVLKNE